MTIRELVSVFRRRWVGVAVGSLITVLLLLVSRSQEPVYSGELVLAIVSDAAYSDLRQPETSLIIVAGIVAEQVSEHKSSGTATDAVSLVGEGLRHGWSVTLPDTGSQWSRRNDRSHLRVQAVGRSEAEVLAMLQRATASVDESLVDLQAAVPVRDEERIRTSALTFAPVVNSNTGSPPRAKAAAVLIGVFIAAGWATVLERIPPWLGDGRNENSL